MWLFRHVVALDDYHTFFDYTCVAMVATERKKSLFESSPRCMGYSSGDLSHKTRKTKGPSSTNVRKQRRFLRVCGHLTVSNTCCVIIKSVGAGRAIFYNGSIQQLLLVTRKANTFRVRQMCDPNRF